jgi:hypothetical protein
LGQDLGQQLLSWGRRRMTWPAWWISLAGMVIDVLSALKDGVSLRAVRVTAQRAQGISVL